MSHHIVILDEMALDESWLVRRDKFMEQGFETASKNFEMIL